MDPRQFEAGASASPPTAPAAPSIGYPTNGNPQTGTPATKPGDFWFYQVAEELRNAIIGAGLTPNASDLTQLSSAIQLAVPAGAVMAFAVQTPPSGFLECNGAAISRTTYAALFSAIGTTFGAGDGSTTFNLPDLRGEFIRGWDNGRGIDAGRLFGAWQKGTLSAEDAAVNSSIGVWCLSSSSSTVSAQQQDIGMDQYSTSDYPNIDLQGASSSVSNTLPGTTTQGISGVVRPRNIALMFCIKY